MADEGVGRRPGGLPYLCAFIRFGGTHSYHRSLTVAAPFTRSYFAARRRVEVCSAAPITRSRFPP